MAAGVKARESQTLVRRVFWLLHSQVTNPYVTCDCIGLGALSHHFCITTLVRT